MADIDKVQAAPVAKGKKGKKKGIQMSWQAFVGTANSNAPVIQPASTNSATCWADEVEDVNPDGDESCEYKINREALPTAPKSVLKAAFDETDVPTSPPFTAFVSNLPFDVNHDEIHKFFKNLNIKEIRLQKDSMGRARGFGHIDFETREMLIGAMSCNELYIKSRPVKVSLQQAVANDYGGRKERELEDDKTMSSNWRRKEVSDGKKDDFDRDGDRGYRGGGERYSRPKEGAADTQDKWKASGTGSSDSNRYSNQRDRYDRDSQDRGNNRDHYNDRNDRGYNNRGNSDRYSDRGNDRGNDRYSDRGNDRYNDRGNDRYNDRGNDRYNDRGNDRYNDRGNDRGNDRSERPNNDQMDREWRRKDFKEETKRGDSHDRHEDKPRYVEPRNDTQPQSRPSVHSPPPPPAAPEVPKERTKLNLKPRTKPIENEVATRNTTKQSSIFGGATPVDTSAKEREVEERLKQKMLEAKKPRERVTSSITSDPKSNSERRGSSDSLLSNTAVSESPSDQDSLKILPAPPPKVNAWAVRKSQQEPRSSPQQSQSDTTAISQNHHHQNSSDRAGSHSVDRHNTNAANTSHSTSSISNKKGDAWVARGGGGRGGGRGGNTTGAGVGRGTTRSKTIPQTIDDMPKAETKTAKDWSNANKFDTLLATDQQNDERDNEDDNNQDVKQTTRHNKEGLSRHEDKNDEDEDDDDNSWSQVTYSKNTHDRLEQ